MIKKELVDEILKIKKVDSKSNLMLKKNEELESILSELQSTSDDVEIHVEKDKQTQPKKPVKIDRDTLVACYNITSGSLNYISKKTGLETVWTNYGDVETIEFGELTTMRASQPKFLREPWIFIEDENVVNQLGLKEVYKNIIPIDKVDDFFKMSAKEAKNILPKLPKGMKELIGDKARKGIQDETLNNLQLIRLLENELHLDLISLME